MYANSFNFEKKNHMKPHEAVCYKKKCSGSTSNFLKYVKPPKMLFKSMAINKQNYCIRLDSKPESPLNDEGSKGTFHTISHYSWSMKQFLLIALKVLKTISITSYFVTKVQSK